MHLCRSCSNVPRLPSLLEMPQNPHVLLTFDKVHNPLRLPRESTSERPKVVRTPCVFTILISKCASRHNGVQFFISHLARWLRTRSLSEPTFRPSGATNHWNNTILCDFPTFSRICIFFLLTLSLLWSSLFYSSLLSDSSHLCFSSVHIVGSLTSKLPSIIAYIYPFMNCKTHVNPAAQLHGDCPPIWTCWRPFIALGNLLAYALYATCAAATFPRTPWISLDHIATILRHIATFRSFICLSDGDDMSASVDRFMIVVPATWLTSLLAISLFTVCGHVFPGFGWFWSMFARRFAEFRHSVYFLLGCTHVLLLSGPLRSAEMFKDAGRVVWQWWWEMDQTLFQLIC